MEYTIPTNWIKSLDKKLTGKDLRPIIEGLGHLMADGKWGEIDTLLHHVHVEKIHTGILVCLLRTTFVPRSKLKEWSGLLQRARAVASSRGEDADRIFAGLS